MCSKCAGFFGELSQTRDFGDRHREKARYFKGELDGMMGSGEEEDLEEDGEQVGSDEDGEMGELGEKSVESLMEETKKQLHTLETLNQELQSLSV
jgi:hypothetical protein